MDGSKTYKPHLPPGIPAKQFWSLVLYDNETRSMLQTDQQFPSIGSQKRRRGDQPRHLSRCVLRSDATAWQGEQLGADLAGEGMERHPSPLWAAQAVLRQDVATLRD